MRTSQTAWTGADIVFECLKREKVEYVFGYPGGAVLKLYERIIRCGLSKTYTCTA